MIYDSEINNINNVDKLLDMKNNELENKKDDKEVVETTSVSVEENNEVVHPAKNRRKKSEASDPVQEKQENIVHDYYKSEVSIDVIKLYPDVIDPAYAHRGDACMDLRANNIYSVVDEMGNEVNFPKDFESITIKQGWIVKFGTGLRINLPKGYSSDILIRSGLSSKEGLILMNGKGEIDCPYTGELIIPIGKLNKKLTTINKNERIAQFKPMPQIFMNLNYVDKFVYDESNERGENGLGSSGLK